MQDLSTQETRLLSALKEAGTAVTSQEALKLVEEKLGEQWSPQVIATFLARAVKMGNLKSENKNGLTYFTVPVAE
jgi:predicted transcriptional regulator